ncbi:MAG: DUF190 domain-containing protein [Ignavibacteria bacterium]|nr:DUF190 domain-containing protein [Ignavibacteria bacterium]
MIIQGEAKLLRIFVGETDKIGSIPVYEKIVFLAKEKNLAGATVYKGVMGFGRNSRIHSAKLLTISEDLPLVVEIVDTEEKITSFIPLVNEVFDKSDSNGLFTVEKAEIIRYC